MRIHDLSDAELLGRMRNFEDHFVERKTASDKKDWRKSAVAFANSAPVGFPCVLYLGVKNNGVIEERGNDLDSLQKTFNQEMQSCYPRIPYLTRIIEADGVQAVAIIVYGSEERPHFSGPAYVRKGSETVDGSATQYDEMVAFRNSKVRKLLEYKNREVTAVQDIHASPGSTGAQVWQVVVTPPTYIHDCNQFYLTVRYSENEHLNSIPLERIEISFDNDANRLRISIHGL